MEENRYGFLYKRAIAIGFRIGEWMNVKAFRNLVDKKIDSKEYISEYDILDMMNEVLKSIDEQGIEEVDGVAVGLLKRQRHKLQDFISTRDFDHHEFALTFTQIYDEIMSNRNNDDYVVNPRQMNKFLDLLSWFMHKAEEFGDKVSVPKLEPKDEHGSMTAIFLMLDLRGAEEIRAFANMIKECSILTFDLGTEGVMIKCTIPNVFVRKDGKDE